MMTYITAKDIYGDNASTPAYRQQTTNHHQQTPKVQPNKKEKKSDNKMARIWNFS